MVMDRRNCLILSKLVFGLLGFSAVVTEIAVLVERGAFSPVNFFSYFTVQSNIIAFTMLFTSAVALAKNSSSHGVAFLRGASTLYMVVTGVVFAVLLAGIDGATLTAVPWDNKVLHYIMPVVLLADWLVDKPAQPLRFKHALLWLFYPLVYVTYSLVRGIVVDWYPYPFLNPSTKGYAGVFVTSLGIALTGVLFVYLLTSLGRGQKLIKSF